MGVQVLETLEVDDEDAFARFVGITFVALLNFTKITATVPAIIVLIVAFFNNISSDSVPTLGLTNIPVLLTGSLMVAFFADTGCCGNIVHIMNARDAGYTDLILPLNDNGGQTSGVKHTNIGKVLVFRQTLIAFPTGTKVIRPDTLDAYTFLGTFSAVLNSLTAGSA